MALDILRNITIAGIQYDLEGFKNYCLIFERGGFSLWRKNQGVYSKVEEFSRPILVNNKSIPEDAETPQGFVKYLSDNFINCCSNIEEWEKLEHDARNSKDHILMNDMFSYMPIDYKRIVCFIFATRKVAESLLKAVKISIKPFDKDLSQGERILCICDYGVVKLGRYDIGITVDLVSFVKGFHDSLAIPNTSFWYDKKYVYTVQVDTTMLTKLKFAGEIK